MDCGQKSGSSLCEVHDLLAALTKSVTSTIGTDLPEKQQRIILSNITNFISMCPNAFGSTLPYDGMTIINKICKKMSINKQRSTANDEKAQLSKPAEIKFFEAVEEIKVSVCI